MLYVFAAGHGTRPGILEKQPASVAELDTGAAVRQFHTNQSLLLKSNVIKPVLKGLATAIVNADEVLMMSLTMTLSAFSYHAETAAALVDAGVLRCLELCAGELDQAQLIETLDVLSPLLAPVVASPTARPKDRARTVRVCSQLRGADGVFGTPP